MIRLGEARVGGCMSIRLRLVGEGVSLLSGCCHDNHESLMPPPARHLPAHSSLCAVYDD